MKNDKVLEIALTAIDMVKHGSYTISVKLNNGTKHENLAIQNYTLSMLKDTIVDLLHEICWQVTMTFTDDGSIVIKRNVDLNDNGDAISISFLPAIVELFKLRTDTIPLLYESVVFAYENLSVTLFTQPGIFSLKYFGSASLKFTVTLIDQNNAPTETPLSISTTFDIPPTIWTFPALAEYLNYVMRDVHVEIQFPFTGLQYIDNSLNHYCGACKWSLKSTVPAVSGSSGSDNTTVAATKTKNIFARIDFSEELKNGF